MNARLVRGENVTAPDQINRSTNSILAGPSKHISVPVIGQDLLTYLNTVFPDSLHLVDAMGSLDAARGARAVVEHLLSLYQDQNQDNHVLRKS